MSDRPVRATVVGECLLELVRTDPDAVSTRPAGDTFNTASTLARAGGLLGLRLEVTFRTGLGDDPLSDAIASAMPGHDVIDGSVRVPGRSCGLYLLEPASGRMWYWREASATRTLFDGTDWLPDGEPPDLAFLSLITLQQMSPASRDAAFAWIGDVRAAGGRVAFSANHRPAGWPSTEEARAQASRFVAASDIVFASDADARALFEGSAAADAAEAIAGLGPDEVVVTAGADGCALRAGGDTMTVAPEPVEAVDPTGAGDALAGGYLAWRLAGRAPDAAVRAATRAAAATVSFVGALPRPGSADAGAVDAALVRAD